MTMPLDLVLVRHGESEGNVAFASSRLGDHSHFTPEFLARHSSKWRLTDKGREQAHAAGEWLRGHLAPAFDRYIKLHNCQVLHYTRRDPASGVASAHVNWMRSVCPWDLNLSDNGWHPIDRPQYSNADLLAVVEKTPRFRGKAVTDDG